METKKFNGTIYNDWLRNLRIILDFENQGYVLDKPLSTALPEGSSPEEHIMFEKWLEGNRKVCTIIVASMINDIQKQYDRLEDVPWIMLRMREVYAVPDRHRYAATKAFFRTKMAEGPFVQSHRVKMLSLLEKLEDLKAGLDNDTYIDVILQSLPHPTTRCLLTTIRMDFRREASTSKAKGKKVGCWKRKKKKGKVTTATASAEAPPTTPSGNGKGKGKVLERSRKLSKDEMIMRLGDGKVVAAEVMGSLNLVINYHIRIELKDCYYVPIMIKNSIPVLDNNGYAFKINKNSFCLMIDDNYHMLDVCGPLNTPKRGGFSYFIKFTDDHLLYGYVYLMRYKSEAFGRFKEYRLDVENQTGYKIKALRSNRGGEYLSGEFIDYLKENGIFSQWTPP
ncbi:UNVERIFIED_CONTAM: hypothetical protein Sradi_7024100 [Sesamum radiatum]|uniref:Integrase catalytic domain-containing protein n=1 Tax=Sesamum radiatum TaxID=300843 RepID=A0AAW2JBB6_SESRA